MLYTEIIPHIALAPYIDAYWSVESTGEEATTNKILPDGCMDIIFNLGEDAGDMKNGKAYLIGTMTRPIESPISPGIKMLGVRFKPAAFSVFYTFSSLHEITDESIECDREIMPEHAVLKNPVEGLNKFFLDRLRRPGHVLFPILEDIRMCHGLVRVDELAKRHFITVRQLERSFKYHIGVSPKECINQVRFRHALQRVSRRRPGEGLSDIAFECGYYDHSHLILEMKKYAGDLPGSLLSKAVAMDRD